MTDNEILTFNDKILKWLDGDTWPRLEPHEVRCVRVFNEVADKFGSIDRMDSFGLSLAALLNCHLNGNSYAPKYVRRACENKHWDEIRRRRRWRKPLETARVRRNAEAFDAKLDVKWALDNMNRRLAEVLRLRMGRYIHDEIAERLGIGTRQVRRLMADAEGEITRLLGPSYGREETW